MPRLAIFGSSLPRPETRRSRLPHVRILTMLSAACFLAACAGDGIRQEAPPATATRAPWSPPEPVLLEGELTFLERQVASFLRSQLPNLDVTRRTVPLRDLIPAGVGVDDGIPSLQHPQFVSAAEASEWLDPHEPVVRLEVGTEARIYPIQILMWHEVVNDTLGGRPVVATFCPLCNTAIAFDRTVAGVVRRFGVSGVLRESDLVMYDLESSTLWQQLTGEAIVGALAGERLQFLPAQILAFADAREASPHALVLSRETGFRREYGQNPYSGYDRIESPFLAPSSFGDDDRLPAKGRVLAVEIEGDALAVGFDTLWQRRVVSATVGGQPIVAFWQPGTSTPLDGPKITASRDIGSATAFQRALNGEVLEFEARDGLIYDIGTGSRWSVAGVAVEGPLVGEWLTPVVAGNHFWFVWSVFKPHTRVIR